jgi:hypothetical protein
MLTSFPSFVMRARIRAPLWRRKNLSDHKQIQHHWQHEDQDWQCQGQDSRRGRLRTLVKTHTGKTSRFRPVGSISDQFPTRGIPRQVSASHDKSPPRPTSLCLAWQVSASHKLPPTPTGAWAMTRNTSLRHEHLHRNARGTIPRAMQTHQLAVMQAAGPDKSLNAGLSGRTTIPSTSSLTLPHANSARGTQAPPTTSSS